jgi:hypothetical protein
MILILFSFDYEYKRKVKRIKKKEFKYACDVIKKDDEVK